MELSDTIIVNSSRLKSAVWNDFDRVKKGDTCIAVCRHCKKKLSGSSTSGTSHLRNHLIRCRRRANQDVSQLLMPKEKKRVGALASLLNFEQEQKHDDVLNNVSIIYDQEQAKSGIINVANYNFDQRRSQIDLARMIILHGYPLSMVDHVGFRTFVKNLHPLFELVPFNRVEADCIEIFEREKQKIYELLDKLPGKVSLSADKWRGPQDIEFLCLMGHYIDGDWQLKKKILNFIMIDPSHTEDMLSEVIMTCLMEWDIDRKLFSMTSDSCSSGDIIISRIRDRLSQNRFLLCNGQLFDVRCAASVINLMVQDALEAVSQISLKIRESVKYVRSSQVTLDKFNQVTGKVKTESQKCLCLDNSIKWNSTYLMLEVALEYREAFSLLQAHDSAYSTCPTDLEWERADAIASCLKLFIDVTNILTSNKSPTANLYFPEICDVHLQLIEWCKNSDVYVSSIALKMKSKFDVYWDKCSLSLAIAATLDPRFKMKLVEYYFPQIYGVNAQDRISDVSTNLRALYNEHAICSPLTSLDQGVTWQVGSGGPNGGCLASVGNEARDRLRGFDKFLHETSQNQSTKSDLDKYLEEPLFPRNVDFSILNWWKVHTPKYPIVSMMARNILGIPMSKVSFESAFDTRGRVLDRHMHSLTATTVQAMICAQDWMRDEQVLDCKSFGNTGLYLCNDMK